MSLSMQEEEGNRQSTGNGVLAYLVFMVLGGHPPSSSDVPLIPAMGGAGGVAVSPSHRDREGHGFESHWSPQQ